MRTMKRMFWTAACLACVPVAALGLVMCLAGMAIMAPLAWAGDARRTRE